MPDALLKKLHHRPGQPVVVLWAPPELEPVLARWEAGGVTVSRRSRAGGPFVLAFFRAAAEIGERAGRVASRATGDDPVLWLVYPKKSSKRYAADVTRDSGWQPFGDLGWEPVSQVALDEDWSALRFRPAERITRFTRGGAISPAGKARVAVRRGG